MKRTTESGTPNAFAVDREQLAAFGRELAEMAKTLGSVRLEPMTADQASAIAQASADVARAAMILELAFGKARS